MKSLGVIETRGLVAAIQAADVACKTAGVELMGYRKVGSGLVTLCLEGEVSAIHAAIESGVRILEGKHPVSSLIIARPESCVVDFLTTLKGCPAPQQVISEVSTHSQPTALDIESTPVSNKPTLPSQQPEKQPPVAPVPAANPTAKKGKKS